MPTLNIEALRQLRRVVENAAEEQLDMASYQSECGTTRCVAGHAAFDPWYRQNTNINDGLKITEIRGKFQPVPQASINEVLMEIHGIDWPTCERLFYPMASLSRSQVIASIDSIIAGTGAIDYDAVDFIAEPMPPGSNPIVYGPEGGE